MTRKLLPNERRYLLARRNAERAAANAEFHKAMGDAYVRYIDTRRERADKLHALIRDPSNPQMELNL